MTCSGAMSERHDGIDVRLVRVHLREIPLCAGCRDAAARLGMIDRREERRPR